MTSKKIKISFWVLIILFSLIRNSEALEVQFQPTFNIQEAKKKIDTFFENNPFDGAYDVVIKDVNVTADGSHLTFKIKLEQNQKYFNSLQSLIENILEYEMRLVPWIGVEFSEEDLGQGAYINKVTPGSPAFIAGLREGDLITNFDGKYRGSAADFVKFISRSKIGEEIEIATSECDPQCHSTKFFKLTISSNKKLVRKSPVVDREPIMKISGIRYSMPDSLYKYIANTINNYNRDYGNPTFEAFPLIIKTFLKDENENSIQVSESSFTGKIFEWGRNGKVVDFTNISLNDSYKETTIRLELNVLPEKINKISAAIVTFQKRKEEEFARQKETEERRKQDELMRAKWEIEEQKSKKEIEISTQAKEKARKTLLPKCDGKIMSLVEFYKNNNSFADKGKCVEVAATSFQMTATNKGLFNIGNYTPELLFIEFNKTFRGSYIKGIAKILGVYNYSTQIGGSNSVPHLKMLHIEEVQ